MDLSQNDQGAKGNFNWRSTLSQTIAASIKNIVLFGYGLILGFPTLLIPHLSGNSEDEEFSLDEDGISWIGSIGLICVPVGCFLSGIITQFIGKKRTMQLINIPFFGSWLLFFFASKIWHIFAALCLTGLAGGLMEAPVTTYVSEITQPHLRGILSSTSPSSVIAGSMVQFILGAFFSWRTLVIISSVIPLVSFTLLFIIPETPYWLLSKKRYAEAKESLAWLRGWVPIEKVDQEYKQLFNQIRATNEQANTEIETLKLFQNRSFLKPFLLVSYLFFLSNFNGVPPIQTYAVRIFTSLNAPINEYHATALLGVFQLCGSVLCVLLVGVIGKRKLILISLIGTTFCFLSLGIYTRIAGIHSLKSELNQTIMNSTSGAFPIDLTNSSKYSWVPLVLIVSSALICHVGIRLLPWILTAEFFPNEIRAVATGFAAVVFYFFYFACNKTFLQMVSRITLTGTFWFYSLMSFIGIVVLFFVLPETEGNTLKVISDHFAGISKLGYDVVRRGGLSGINNEAFDGNFNKKSNVESKL